MALTQTPTHQDITEACRRIAPHIHQTPILTSKTLDRLSGAELYFKCENFQKAGSFKARGATNVLLQLKQEDQLNSVATHSSGNHGQALAMAARSIGIPATVVMPENAPTIKVAAVRDYGAEVIFCEATQEARESTLQEIVERSGAQFVPPFDDYDIIAGQSTCAQELLAQQPRLDTIVTPVGGGGLLAGTALAVHYQATGTKVIGAEPALADDAAQSFRTGEYQPRYGGQTVADGVRVALGRKPFKIIKNQVDDIFTATDEEIIAAMRLVWERMKIIVEPSCVIPLAVVLKNRDRFQNQRIGIILTGGNVDLEKLPFK